MWKRLQQILHPKTAQIGEESPVGVPAMAEPEMAEPDGSVPMHADAPEGLSEEPGFQQLFHALLREQAEDPQALAASLERLSTALREAGQAPPPEGLREEADAQGNARVTGCAAPAMRVPLSGVQRRELAQWNRDYPQYRMSEAEYYRAIHEDTERK